MKTSTFNKHFTPENYTSKKFDRKLFSCILFVLLLITAFEVRSLSFDSIAVNMNGLSNTGKFLGDINNDGKLDLVTSSPCAITSGTYDNQFNYAFGNGDGTFGAATKQDHIAGYSGGNYSILLADVNNDTKLDVIESHGGTTGRCFGDRIAICIGTGSSFNAATLLTGSGSVCGITICDFDSDSKVDIACEYPDGSSMNLFWGNGDGTFTAPTGVSLGVTEGARCLRVADLDGDTRDDLIFSRRAGDAVSVIMGNGTRTVGTRNDYAVSGLQPYGIAVADFNGDGNDDVVSANSGDGSISFLPGNGNGTFGTASNYAIGLPTNRTIETEDFNNDGKMDIAIGGGAAYACIRLGNGDGTFGSANNYNVNQSSAYDIAVGDLNNDGWPDLVSGCDANSDIITVLINTTGLPVADYQFLAGIGGTAFDSSGNGLNAALYNSPLWCGPPPAIDFDGTDDYAMTSDAAPLDITTGITMSVWIKRDRTSWGSEEYIIGKAIANENSYSISISPANNVKFMIANSGPSPNNFSSTGTINDYNWHHIAITYDGSNMKIYIDGVLNVSGGAASGNIYSGLANLCIGGNGQESWGYFDGLIGHAMIFNSAFDSALIYDLFVDDSVTYLADWAPPDNDMTLSATAIDVDKIALFWNPSAVDSLDADSVGIWYKTGDFPAAAYDGTLVGKYALNDSTDTVTGLATGTMYYFGLMVRDTNENWSDTSSTGKYSVQTLTPGLKVWDGGGATQNWSEAANWLPDAVPALSDSVVFNATSSKSCILNVNDTIKAITFTSGYTGMFRFSSKTLVVTGDANFRYLSSMMSDTGTLIFSAPAAQNFTPCSNSFPDVIVNSTANVTVLDSTSLYIRSLTINVGGTFTAPQNYWMYVKGSFLNNGTFNHNGGHIQFDSTYGVHTVYPGGDPFNYVAFGQGGCASRYDLTGALVADTIRVEYDTINLGSFTHTVNVISYGMSSRLDFNACTLKVASSADFSGFEIIDVGTGVLELTAPDTQTIMLPWNKTLPTVLHTGPGKLKLNSDSLDAVAFVQTAGQLDFNYQDVNVSGEFKISNGTDSTFINLAQRKIAVGGDANFEGLSGSLLNLNPSQPCTLNVTGNLVSIYSTIGNCHAIGSAGTADYSCVDSLNNINWSWADIMPPSNIATYPKMGSVVKTSAAFLVKINETGIAYFVLVPNGALAPSSFQVSLGQDASGNPAAFSGNSGVAANVEDTLFVSGLNSFTTYDAYIVAKDAFNNLQNTPVKLTFTTGDGIPPDVVSLNPPDNGTGVGLSNNLIITFGEIVNKGTGNITIARSSDMTIFELISVGSANVTGGGTATITINPASTFTSETGYYVLIDSTCFVDTAGNRYAGITANTTWNFTTVDVLTDPPTLSAPGIGGNIDDTFNIDFALPENALSGSVKMTFTQASGSTDPNSPHIITFISDYETAGSHSTVLLGKNLSNNGNVSSVTSDPNDALVKDAFYDVKIEYQDALGNPAAQVTNTGILYIGGELGNDVSATLTNSSNNAVIVSLTRSTTPISSVAGIYFNLAQDTIFLDTATALRFPYDDTTFVIANITTQGTYYGAWALFDSAGNMGLMRCDSVAIGNVAPVLSLPTVDTAYEDSLWTIANFASDLNNDPLDLLLLRAPTGMSLSSSSQTITWTPAHSDVGSHTVIVRADDLNGGIDTDTMTLRVLGTNVSPVLSLPGSVTLLEDTAWAIDNFATDINGDSIILALRNAPAGMNVIQSALAITWTPRNDDVGTYSVTVIASDPKGAADSAVISITVLNTNDYPVIFSASFPDTVYEDSLVVGSIGVSDPDNGDTVFLTFSPDVPWLDIEMIQGSVDSIWQFTIKGIPTDAYTGSIQFTSYVSDKEGLVVTSNHLIFVINTNDPPNTFLNNKERAYGALLYNLRGVDDSDTMFTFIATINDSANRFDSSMTNTSGLFPIYPLPDGRYIFSCYTRDKEGLSDLTPYKDTITIIGVSTHTWSDSGVWDMSSIPALSYNAAPFKTAGVILHWDESRNPSGIYKYYTRSEGINSLTSGKSYWTRLDKPVTVTLKKDSLCKDTASVYLHKAEYGWNQVASPYPYPVKWTKPSELWKWDPLSRDFQLSSDGILYPWIGYWTFTEAADTVYLPPNPAFGTRAALKQSRTCFENRREWTFGIELTTNVNRDAGNLFGISRHAKDGYDHYDQPEPPRMGSEPYLYFAHPEWKRSIDRFASDIRRTWHSKVNIFQVGISPCERDVTALTLNITGFNEEAPIYLFVNTPSGVIEYKPGMALKVEPSDKEQYHTIFATADKDFLNTFPQKFMLNSPYPNPCRPLTTIRYTLPYNWGNNGWLDAKPYRVRMILYDAKGRVVRELINRKQKPGHYKVVWRGKGDTGRYVASGTYFCRLTAGKYSSVKKIIAIR